MQTVLVVDDSTTVGEAARLALATDDYSPTHVRSAADAVAWLSANTAHVVLLDHGLQQQDPDWQTLQQKLTSTGVAAVALKKPFDVQTLKGLLTHAKPATVAPQAIQTKLEPMVQQVVAKAQDHIEAAAPAFTGASRAEIEAMTRRVIEEVVWEVVPQLAETIIREELDKLLKQA